MLKNWLQSHKIFFLIWFFLAGRLTLVGAIRNEKANVLLVTVDTIRPDRLSCYSKGYLETVHIDRLAKNGVLFERAFAHNPLTLPSHVNIMTGTTPLYHGVSENAPSFLTEELLTLAEYLKSNGYLTAAFIGAFPLDSRFGLNQGFDVYDESYPAKSGSVFVYPERKAEKVVASALSWMATMPEGKKWFCWIHLWDPHAPYWPPEPYATRFKNDPYTGEVAYVDEQLGRLFWYLEKNHLEERTLIILTGDHGEALGEHGEMTHSYFAYNSTIWIPLIIAGPGIKLGRRHDYVAHVDLFPTVADYLGLPIPKHLQGVSLVPLLEGKKIEERPIYFESLEPHLSRGWAPLRGLIYRQKKFIESPLPELYDLVVDFEEKNNLALQENLQPFQKQLKALRGQWSSPYKPKGQGIITREIREKMRSLGYVASQVGPAKEIYGPEDDLKTLLPYEQKIDQAIFLEEKGRIAESVYLLHQIIKERKDFGKAYDRLAQLYRRQGLKDEALKIMEEGYKLNPRNYALVSGFGIILVQEGRPDQGISVLLEALSLFDRDPEVYNHLGMAYWMKGDWEKSRSAYEQAVAIDPHDGLIFNNYATLYLSMGSKSRAREDFVRAEELFKKSIEMDPDFPAVYNGLGSVYKLTGRLEEAISSWEKALEIRPDYDYPLYNLGRAYLEKGLKLKALECFNRYLELKGKKISPEERREVEELIAKCR